MTRRATLWWSVAAAYAAVNVLGVVYAVGVGEQMHAMTHVALLLVGAVVTWAVVARARRPETEMAEPIPMLSPADERLSTLQHSVDAIAVELERIGEAQRFRDKLKAKPPEPER
jgi:hypothetical protein